MFYHFLIMKYEFNSRYINLNRINLEKTIYNNIVKNMRKNCGRNIELKENEWKERQFFEDENKCNPSWPICLDDSDEENLVSTIVLRTEDKINFIENYFFKVSSKSYGMYEMSSFFIKDEYMFSKFDEKNENEIIDKDKEKVLDIELQIKEPLEKEKPIDAFQNVLELELNREEEEYDNFKDKDSLDETDEIINYQQIKHKKRHNTIENNTYEQTKLKKRHNTLDYVIKENIDINCSYSSRINKDLLIERKKHKCLCQKNNVRQSMQSNLELGSSVDSSFIVLTGTQLKKTESKGFNYIKYYVSMYFS
jgi:hypothetical protein